MKFIQVNWTRNNFCPVEDDSDIDYCKQSSLSLALEPNIGCLDGKQDC